MLFQDFDKKLENSLAQKKKEEEPEKKEDEKDAEGEAPKEKEVAPEKVAEPEPEYESPILYEKTCRVGISNKSHTKVLNSIQIIYVFEIM